MYNRHTHFSCLPGVLVGDTLFLGIAVWLSYSYSVVKNGEHMKFLFDFFPVILFFVAFKTFDLFVATAVIMAASLLQIAIHWVRTRKFETMHVITFAAVVLLGGATLIFRDERFIKWKPTVAYWITALVFAGSHFVGSKKTVIQRLMGEQISLANTIWTKLNISWIIFFILAGALNLAVAFNASTEVWVNFKLFGLLAITLVFAVIQGLFINKFIPQNETVGNLKSNGEKK
jgi:intracellular septation protein